MVGGCLVAVSVWLVQMQCSARHVVCVSMRMRQGAKDVFGMGKEV